MSTKFKNFWLPPSANKPSSTLRDSKAVSRRDAMRLAALGAASWQVSGWLTGCASEPLPIPNTQAGFGAGGAAGISGLGATSGSSGAGTAAPTSGSSGLVAPRAPLANAAADAGAADLDSLDAGDDLGPVPQDPRDPNVSWWMQYEFAPVASENESTQLEVIGSIPPELSGLYLRNGPNPVVDCGHWFLGNGMVHGVRLEAGKALWYKNRYVQTPLLKEPPGTLASPLMPSSNVSVVYHASRLLALGEVGLPFELSTDNLSTIGKYDFNGKLAESLTAHPKIDPVSGEMLAFAYTLEAPYLQYYQIDPKGSLTRTVDITAPNRSDGFGSKMTMMHDFQITQSKVVFLHLPITFDLETGASGKGFPFLWDQANGTQLGIMPRNGGNADVVWIDIEPCWIFHTLNAYDDDNGNVVLEAVRVPGPLWERKNTDLLPSPLGSYLVRYTIDPKARTAKLETLSDRFTEFPTIDRRTASLKNRYGYMLDLAPNPKQYEGSVKGVLKYDRASGVTTEHAFGPGWRPDEAIFVPAANRAAEDEGYLLTYAYDRRTEKSSLFVLDASNMSAKPIAQIKLPYRVPCGFHGIWIPS